MSIIGYVFTLEQDDLKECAACSAKLNFSSFKQRKRKDNIYYYPYCNSCLSKNNKIYKENNKEKILQYEQDRYQRKAEQIKTVRAQFYCENKTNILQSVKEYKLKNKDKINQQSQARKKLRKITDPAYKLKLSISNTIYQALRKNSSSKKDLSCSNFLPFTMDQLKQHLESQFEPWMNWSNHGVYSLQFWDDNNSSTWRWQLDHIVPQSQLLYASMEEENFQKCWSLENLRPYSAKQNLLDNNRKAHI